MKLIRHVTNMLLAAFVCGTLGLVEFDGIASKFSILRVQDYLPLTFF